MAYATHDYTKGTTSGSKPAGGSITDKASEAAEKVSGQIGSAVGAAEGAIKNLAERGSEATEQVQEMAGKTRDAVDKSLKDQPMTTLAIAALMGFALGALWKS
jgi:ElaB/YqjD/DUF883 family membrane-anchored ribosome-binding protein